MSAASLRADGARVRRSARKDGTTSSSLPTFVSVADVLVGDLLEGTATADRVERLVLEAAASTGLARTTAARGVYTLLVRNPRLASAEPAVALKAQLNALLRFAPISHSSVWLVDPGREVCAAKVGERVHTRRLKALAVQAVTNAVRPAGRGSSLRALSITSGDGSVGALVVQVKPGRIMRALDYAGEAVDFLAPIVERQLLLHQTLHSAGQLLETAERRITRFGFDIHDGPLQGISLLAGELSAFERELHAVVPNEGAGRMVEKRVGHLTDIVTELEQELRDLAVAAGRGAALPLREVLERELASFERRTGTCTKLVINGEVDRTTASQRIAVTRVVDEALANVREHARASQVEISVRRDTDVVQLCVADDGRGFDVARATRRAERDHRLGLVAMGERVRLLGGHLEIDSRPGGPTVISAVLPAWSPAG